MIAIAEVVTERYCTEGETIFVEGDEVFSFEFSLELSFHSNIS
jgi:hypothetical protein